MSKTLKAIREDIRFKYKIASPVIRVNISEEELDVLLNEHYLKQYYKEVKLTAYSDVNRTSRPKLGASGKGWEKFVKEAFDEDEDPSSQLDSLVSDVLGHPVIVECYVNDGSTYDLVTFCREHCESCKCDDG